MNTEAWGWINPLYGTLVGVGVPLFITLSGALVLNGSVRSVKEFLSRRMSRIVWPFLLWATGVYVLSVLTHKYDGVQSVSDALVCYFPYLLNNQINESHWCVHMILVLYLLAPFVQRALLQSSQREVEGLLMGWGVLVVLRNICPEIYALRFTSSLLVPLGCFIAGYYVRRYRGNITSARMVALLLCVCVLLFTANASLYARFSIFVPLIAVLLVAALGGLPLPGVRFVSAVSRYSFMIYLIHIPLIRALIQVMHLSPSPEQWWAGALPVGLALAVLCICMAVCRVCESIPCLRPSVLGISA